MNKMLRKKQANLSYLVAVVPILYNGGYGFGGARSDKRPDTPGLVNSRRNSFFVFFPSSLSPFLSHQKIWQNKNFILK